MKNVKEYLKKVKTKKKRIFKSNKYIEMCINIYIYIYIYIYKHENKQMYGNACRKIFIWDYKRVYKKQKF